MLRAVLAVALASLATGCPLLDVEAEFEDLLVTYSALEVEAVPAGEAQHIERSFAVDDLMGFEKIAQAVDRGSVELVSADLRPASGIPLDFVQRATITVKSGDPDAGLPPLTYACDGDCTVDSGVLAVQSLTTQNVLAYLQTGSLLVELTIDGDLPTVAWTVDVDLRFRGKVAVTVDHTGQL
jgi:hypothetical protein